MTYREATRKLKKLGCDEIPRRSGGSHRKWLNRSTGAGTTLPDWGGRDLKVGTLRAVVRQLGLEWDDFERA
ncbi:MAG: type II toxin-antitoxin system HicA family toxin [Chloroflexota bacterium]